MNIIEFDPCGHDGKLEGRFIDHDNPDLNLRVIITSKPYKESVPLYHVEITNGIESITTDLNSYFDVKRYLLDIVNVDEMVKELESITSCFGKVEDLNISVNMFDIINEIFNDFIKHKTNNYATFKSTHITESMDMFVYKHNYHVYPFIGEIDGDKYIISFDPYHTTSNIIFDNESLSFCSDPVLKDKKAISSMYGTCPEEPLWIFAKYLDPSRYTDIKNLELYKTKILRKNMTESDLEKIWHGVR